MRNVTFAVLAVLLFAFPAAAQTEKQDVAAGHARLSVFVSNLSYTESDISGTNFRSDLGMALEYRFRDRWAAELAVTREEVRYFTAERIVVLPDGTPTTRFRAMETEAYPVELSGQYHFFTRNNWKPFLGLGVRYVSFDTPGAIDAGQRLSTAAIGGVNYLMGDRLSLRLDGRLLLREDDAVMDDRFKASVGIGWRF